MALVQQKSDRRKINNDEAGRQQIFFTISIATCVLFDEKANNLKLS
jgi:hypothetical protein